MNICAFYSRIRTKRKYIRKNETYWSLSISFALIFNHTLTGYTVHLYNRNGHTSSNILATRNRSVKCTIKCISHDWSNYVNQNMLKMFGRFRFVNWNFIEIENSQWRSINESYWHIIVPIKLNRPNIFSTFWLMLSRLT